MLMIHLIQEKYMDFHYTIFVMSTNQHPPKKYYKCGAKSVRKLVQRGVDERKANNFDLTLALNPVPMLN